MPLLLALIGDLVASWLQTRRHLTNFALLRALGAEPRQITGVLLWENGFVYSVALIIGAALGWLIAVTLIPGMLFTGVTAGTGGTAVTSTNFFVIQNSPPVQVVVPAVALAALGALLLIGALALGMMTRLTLGSAIAQTLRLNED